MNREKQDSAYDIPVRGTVWPIGPIGDLGRNSRVSADAYRYATRLIARATELVRPYSAAATIFNSKSIRHYSCTCNPASSGPRQYF
jgi:hypothetical protein